MSVGIAKSLETIADLKDVVLKSIQFGKDSRPMILKISLILEIGRAISELVADAPAALPELSDVDAVEAGQLTTAAYAVVNDVLKALKA